MSQINTGGKEEKAIVPATTEVVAPIVVPPLEPDQVIAHFNKIQELKRKLIDPETDMVKIANRPYILKSGWRKLAFAFNLKDEIVKEEREERPDGEVIYRIWAKVTAPNGRYVVAVGCASSRERKFTHEAHDPYALAHTRSKNRGISDIIGLGEVSAEELLGEEEQPAKPEPVQGPAPAKAGRPPQADEVAANFEDMGDGKALRCKLCSMLVRREDAPKHLEMHKTKKLASEGQKNYIRYLCSKLNRALPEDLEAMTFEEASLYIDYLKGSGEEKK